jgi:hypothetical protein
MSMTLVVSMGLIGLVVDEGWAYWRQEACLTAAQAAANGAIMYVKSNVTGTISCTTSVVCQAATQCPTSLTTVTSDIIAGCMYAKQNGFQATGKQNVTMEAQLGNPPTVSGITAAYYVTVRVSESVPLTFLSVIARQTSSIVSANATAAMISTQAGSCIYVLDPSSSHALEANNNAQISASCGIWVDSNSSTAAHATGSAKVATTGTPQPNITVVGTAVTDNAGSFSPNPVSGSSISDPLSSLETPWTYCTGTGCPTTNCEYTGCSTAHGTCDHSSQVSITTANGGTPAVLNPGVYCGGISVSNGSSVTFNSGMYVIYGGGVSIQSGSQNSGSGVIFYLTGTNSTYQGFTVGNGVTNLTLSPPTSGGLAGVLIYQDRSLTPTTSVNYCDFGGSSVGVSSVCGGATSKLNGIIYLPTTRMAFTNGTSSTQTMSLVVYDAYFNGGSYYFSTDTYGTLHGGSGGNKPYLVGAN